MSSGRGGKLPGVHEAILPLFQIVKTGQVENPVGFQPAAGYD